MAKAPVQPEQLPETAPEAPLDPAFESSQIIKEQRERSAEIEAQGVEAWKAAHDDRAEEDRPVLVKGALPIGDVLNTRVGSSRQVPGITHPTTDTVKTAR